MTEPLGLSEEDRALIERVCPTHAEQSIMRLYPETCAKLLAAAREEALAEPVAWRLTWKQQPFGLQDYSVWHRDHLSALEREAEIARTFPGNTDVKITPLYEAAARSQPIGVVEIEDGGLTSRPCADAGPCPRSPAEQRSDGAEIAELVRAVEWVLKLGDPDLPEQMLLADALLPFKAGG